MLILGFLIVMLQAPSSAALAKIEVQGHRGARGLRPENTIPAFAFGLEKGVDVLELDIAVTSDNIPVISHDPFLNPDLCLDGKGQRLQNPVPIRKISLKDLKTYDCGTLKNPRFKDQIPVPKTKIPTLQELFDFVKGQSFKGLRAVDFNIETKISPGYAEFAPEPEAFAKLIVDVARSAGFIKNIRIQSFDDRTLFATQKIAPEVPTILLIGENHVDFVAAAKAAKVKTISPQHNWVTPEDVKALHAAGIQVIPWTANDEKSWKKLVDMKVDGIITDYPDRLIDWLKARK
ncbi:MAG: glycerophosphodiester phosphodiesterase [Bdellovibrionales bacterium]|nr:glycerophosphodiester phosphodiesterase [Bdellovibrionales bacterium]